ncbi:MAG: bifunctional riboflavin kinase/FAD synthetase [Chitinophagaceae bacterium]|nr:bifunctional riboflavin kinase/FAD synthetase [Chitinophagaceae bacterium]
MIVHHDLKQLPNFKNAVITTGAFDGVHIGHQEIITRMKQIALEIKGETVIVTFHPHPRKVISSIPGEIKQLTSLEERIELLTQSGIDHLVVVKFDYAFSNLSADEYIKAFLFDHFHPHTILVGYDHRFGNGRNGNYDLLEKFGNELGFKVEQIHEKIIEQEIVSSTQIRNYILEHQIEKANALLGYPYLFDGFVVRGNQIGRTIGFPTANLHINDEEKIIPSNGVYAVKVKGNCLGNIIYNGMMNIGIRPTVDGQKKVIEVHILDFDQDIYEQNLTVMVYEYIRGEVKFDGLEALKVQLAKDKITTAAILAAFQGHP